MSLAAISAVAAVGNVLGGAEVSRPRASAAPPSGGDFAAWLTSEVREVDQQIHTAEDATRALAMGDTQAIHTTMLSLERARQSLEFVVQVRNRLVEAYQDLIRMQI